MGILETRHGGTVFLDGITALAWRLQARLLDLLDERRLCRKEVRAWVHVDVRILASTSMNIEYALAAGKLREDLYRRMESLTLYLPLLDERQKRTPRALRGSLTNFGAVGDAKRESLAGDVRSFFSTANAQS